ncbi:MAG: hypothetical protein GKS00_17910 [Alphaproteobacteria bacterium]|nr:hypothetical protein [Alphaproteobacteria bacterium]
MPASNETEIVELMTDAAAALKALNDADGADQDTKDAAYEAYVDVLRLIGLHAVASYEGRTALLTGLIAELAEVNKSIQVSNPIVPYVDELTKIGDKAVDLFKKEKKAAASGG